MAEGYLTRADLRDELRHYATKRDLARLEVKISEAESRLIKWMIGLIVGAAAVASSVALITQRILE